MVEVRYILFAFIITLIFSVSAVHATGITGIADNSGSFNILVGNSSQTYNLTVNITTNESIPVAFNVTFILPYGLQNNSICHGQANPVPNIWNCIIIYTPINRTGFLQANLSVKANLSAYPAYGNLTLNFTVVANDSTSNYTQKSVRGINFWKNPRPQSSNPQLGSVYLRFVDWRQLDSTYKVNAPIWTFNSTSHRPQLAGSTYGDVIYFDKSMFEEPAYMRMWGYNLSFKIIFEEVQNKSFIISTPINNTAGSGELQSLMPLLIQAQEQQNPSANSTRNMTIAVPAQSGFTVYLNNTPLTDARMQGYGLNITYAASDQSSIFLVLNVSTNNMSLINNTEVYVMFTTTNMTSCSSGGSCVTSPIYVTTQQSNGLTPDQPPKFGTSLNVSYLMNITNRLANYTLDNLYISFMQPMNVTMNESGTVRQFNMTYPNQVKMQVWNSTNSWQENLSTVRNNSNFSFTEAMGPGAGSAINIFVSTFDVFISNNTATFDTWTPGNTTLYAYLNFTAEMTFPTMDETTLPAGSAGSTNSYNVTTNSPMRSALNLTEKVPGLDSTSTNVAVTLNGVTLNSANYTIGSLILNDVPSGSSTITVSYRVPSSSTTTSTSTSSSGGGGGSTPTTGRVAYIWNNLAGEKEQFLNISDSKIPFTEIHFQISQNTTNAKLTVESLSGKPSNSTIPDGIVYRYMSITPANILQSNLDFVKIRFEVNSSWLAENGFSNNEIILQRFVDGEWQKLTTVYTGVRSDKKIFEAETPGFSYFVITGGAAQEEPPAQPVEQVACGNGSCEEEEDIENCRIDCLPDCGDGICQEVTCTAIGCPVAENNDNCPEDCPPVMLPPAPPSLPSEEQPLPFETSVLIIVGAVLLIIIGGYLYFHKFGK